MRGPVAQLGQSTWLITRWSWVQIPPGPPFARAKSPRHLFLKNVGKAFLYNQGCYLVDTEVKLNQLGLKRFDELDSHTVIDVCGAGLKYFPHSKRRLRQEDFHNFDIANPQKYEYGYNIIRGIEIKVSRSDFRNWFICSGCNYHYVLTPMRMLASYEVPKGVGLIEYNRYKFSCELNIDESYELSNRAFHLNDLRVVKRPVFRNIPQFQIDNAIARMTGHQRKRDLENVQPQIQNDMEERGRYLQTRNRKNLFRARNAEFT